MKKILAILAIILLSSTALAQTINHDRKEWYSMGQEGAAPPQWTDGNEYVRIPGWQNPANNLCIPQADANCNLFTAPGAGAIWEVRIRDGNGATLADVYQPSTGLTDPIANYYLNTIAVAYGLLLTDPTQFAPTTTLAGQQDDVPNTVYGLGVSSWTYGFDGTNWDRIDAPTHADDLANATNGLNTGSFNYGFDGTNWDRIDAPTHADALSNALSGFNTGSFTYGFNGATWDRIDAPTHADNLANATNGLNTGSFTYGFDGTTWDRIDSPTHGDNLANTLNGLNTASFLYAYDGTTWDRVLVGASGEVQMTDVATRPGEDSGNDWRKIKKEETATTTPAVEQTTDIGTTTVTCLAAREIVSDVNFCVYIENTDGADPMTDIDIEVSPDSSTWIDLGWDDCDTMAAGAACVYCVSGNAYRYVRLRCTAADANRTSSDVWYTANKG